MRLVCGTPQTKINGETEGKETVVQKRETNPCLARRAEGSCQREVLAESHVGPGLCQGALHSHKSFRGWALLLSPLYK